MGRNKHQTRTRDLCLYSSFLAGATCLSFTLLPRFKRSRSNPTLHPPFLPFQLSGTSVVLLLPCCRRALQKEKAKKALCSIFYSTPTLTQALHPPGRSQRGVFRHRIHWLSNFTRLSLSIQGTCSPRYLPGLALHTAHTHFQTRQCPSSSAKPAK